MQKILKASLTIAILLALFIANNAQAQTTTPPPLPSLDQFYTTRLGPNLNTPAKKHFDLDQRPTTYFEFSNLKPNKNLKLTWTWTWLSGKVDIIGTFDRVIKNESFSEGFYADKDAGAGFAGWWNSRADIDKIGKWQVRLDWTNGNAGGYSTYAFGVAPEPVSSTLFLVGGLAMGGRTLRRKFAL